VKAVDVVFVRVARVAVLSAACAAAGGSSCPAQPASPVQQSEKETRTAAQQKIDSQILQEIYRKRGQKEKLVSPEPTLVRIDARGRALVDIRARVTTDFVNRVKKRGGVIVSTDVKYDSIIARVPLLEIERLASDSAVRTIVPAAEATTVRHHSDHS
jgi:hypothetical protein